MTTVNEFIEAEEQERHEFLDVGPRALTPFEAMRLAEDPCRPILLDYRIEAKLLAATCNYWSTLRAGRRAVPGTCSREFVRAEGSL